MIIMSKAQKTARLRPPRASSGRSNDRSQGRVAQVLSAHCRVRGQSSCDEDYRTVELATNAA
jgi:hypothetical protein